MREVLRAQRRSREGVEPLDLVRPSGEIEGHLVGPLPSRGERPSLGPVEVHGPVLAVAWQEQILRQVIDLDQQNSGESESPLAREFRLLGIDKPLAALYVNPRAFDAHLRQKAAGAAGDQAAPLQALRRYWTALDGLAFSVVLQKDLELSVAIRARTQALPPAARRLLQSASQTLEVLRRLPEDSLFCLAGRTDVTALVETLRDFLPDAARRGLREAIDRSIGTVFGDESVRQIFTALGPDWGFCLLAPSAEEKSWIPAVVAAVRIQKGSKELPADLTISNALHSLATLAVVQHNQNKPGGLRLRSLIQNGAEVKYLESPDFPPGFQPGVTLRDGYLVVATSVKTLQRFQSSGAGKRYGDADAPFLRVSFREATRYLRERREAVAAYSSQKDQITLEEASKRIDHILTVLQFLDRVELTQRSDPGRAILTLRVRLTEPLR